MVDQDKQEEPLKEEECPSTFVNMDVMTELKAEPLDASPSQSPTLNNDNEMSPKKFKFYPTPTPPPSTTNGATSMRPSPPLTPLHTPSAANSKKLPTSGPQLIGDLPLARNEALASFREISENNYQYKTLGRSREALESMTCDCSYEHGVDHSDSACGHDSDCINRLTQVECLSDDCRCRSYCQNQRFQRKEYAYIEIVLTEKKGYGLRAERDIPKDAFVYEYVGDVVNPASFKKRMREYAAEGIQHFYFMMLQKDEFIDATKSGGIGRFANHSCKPNCYVAKWTIGNYVRMGIFAKRNIQKYEELTFNYNVDRYGHQAQTCYCGEPNCVGHIGGKTQTDIAAMDDLYLDALGITDEADLLELKGSKKKKGKKIDDPDFMPMMKPIVEKDVPKVVQAIRQTQSRKVLYKLLTRIKITEDQAALRQIMRLRGYSLMTNVLEDYATDLDLTALALECMTTWPLLNRNKVEDSRVIVPVQVCAERADLALKDLAQKLIDHWDTLPTYNRIPKRIKQDDEEEFFVGQMPMPKYDYDELHPNKRQKVWEEASLLIKPLGKTGGSQSKNSAPQPPPSPKEVPKLKNSNQFSRESIQAIIVAAAEAEAEAAKAAATAATTTSAEEAKAGGSGRGSGSRKRQKPPKKILTPEEKEANREKRLLKLIGAVVVKCMSKYSKAMDHDLFKKHAKELTQIIADKEKKSSSYKEWKLDQLSDEKVAKIKTFAKEYIAKVLRKLEKSGHRPRPSSSTATRATPSTSLGTPNSTEGADGVTANVSMSVEEAMDMDPDSDDEEEGNGDGKVVGNGIDGFSGSTNFLGPSPEPTGDMMVDQPPDLSGQPSDPRRRPPVGHGDSESEPCPSRVNELAGMN